MAIVSGNGGYLSLFPSTMLEEGLLDEPVEVRIDLTTWVGNWECDYVPATPSGSGNGTLYLPVIGRHSWQAIFPLDDSQNTPALSETTGDHFYGLEFLTNNGFDQTFKVGMSIYEAFFRRGKEIWVDGLNNEYRVYDKLERTTVTNIEFLTDSSDALRVRLSGMGGRLTQGHTILVE